ncbi:MAG TPA: NAD kinase [Flavobacteriaceae bacterium]|nr:NAD kinase [Flavobacteriaceae bacterium]|tara:strand:- start:197 stop:1084 length:888 start_codon:yes stop_codon:yes gene_type:complete
MKVAIFTNLYKKYSSKYLLSTIKKLLNKSIDVFIDEKSIENMGKKKYNSLSKLIGAFSKLDKSFDYAICIGGDGTILRASTYINSLSIPIIGINTGRLGFLAKIKPVEINNVVNALINKKYEISERTLVAISSISKNQKRKKLGYALNEISITRKNTTSLITIETKLNGNYLNTYWADGLIIATPTGSTGYSLSCGGPIIMPESKNLVITPIAPHNLNARPLVIPDNTEITIKISGRENEFFVSLDSEMTTLSNENIISIKKASHRIKMVELEKEDFLKTLRDKLLWGKDKRTKQ